MTERAHVVVVGNAKGGSGKSTTAMHVAVRLLGLGLRVGLVDLDDRQRTLSRYMENRDTFAARHGLNLPMPRFAVGQGGSSSGDNAAAYAGLCDILQSMVQQHDCVLIDCPGSDTYLARVAHGCADTLVTPLNDSFIDLDLLARVDPDTHRILEPSWYSEMVWEQRKRRFLSDGSAIDWIVVRNRLSQTEARNKKRVQSVLQALSRYIGFRIGPGLGERVIFRELFLCGLTLTDIKTHDTGLTLTMSHVAAHQEIKDLVSSLRLGAARQSLRAG